MKGTRSEPTLSPAKRESLRVALEALAVAMVGFGLALAANGLSPRGLALRRDYFPAGTAIRGTNDTAAPPKVQVRFGSAAGATATNEVTARLEAKGLRSVPAAEAIRLFHDPRYVQELVVFIDARNDAEYQEGHIPGAYGFDHYYPERSLPVVLPACQQAETIVVYCRGGDCEDSEFAALHLKDAGIPLAQLGVYGGGITDWITNGMPLEVGPRGSGILRTNLP